VHLTGKSYDSSKANTWTATVGGTTTSGTFGESLDKTIPVPQGGATTSWSATVQAFDGSYKSSGSGTVGPCGTVPPPPKPADDVQTKDEVSSPNCTTYEVTTTHYSRTIPYVLDTATNTWVPGTPGPYVVTGTDTRYVTQQECEVPPKPSASEVRDVVDSPNCTTFVTSTEHQAREATYEFSGAPAWKWTQNGFTPWHTVSTTAAPASQQECPPPSKPAPIVSSTHHSNQKCGDAFKTVVTSTTTTDYVLDEATRTWSLGEPVVVNTSTHSAVAAMDCLTKVKTVADPTAELPNTGGPSWVIALAGALLLFGGFGIVWFQRRTPRWN
jgi:LPXTG-motif cell wall-anchored protein